MPGFASAEDFPEFIANSGTGTIPHIEDETQEIWNRFGITQQSTYVYINDDGTFQQAGYGNLASDVAALLAR